MPPSSVPREVCFIPFSPPHFLVLGSLGLALLSGLHMNLGGVEGTWAYGFLSFELRFLSGGQNSFLDIRGGHGVLLHICVLKSNSTEYIRHDPQLAFLCLRFLDFNVHKLHKNSSA